MTRKFAQPIIIIIFALSGFSGLIYESVWTHYARLLLGHAAYAQALVLIIFMGGMALGAWLVSSMIHRFRDLFLAYVLVELVIGVSGLLFHQLFQFVSELSFTQVIPALGSPMAVLLYKLMVAIVLMLPTSILLGATFPLMSGGFIRRFPESPGKSVAILYCANSAGAAIALIVSGFYLTAVLGLPGTLLTAGMLNIGLALLLFVLVRERAEPRESRPASGHSMRWPWLFLGASLMTGMASFIYEVVWIRMLSMVLGASTHSFELMLSAFISGLAIGGYWIRNRLDGLDDPVRYAGLIQITMGVLAFMTIYLYGQSFGLMSFFMSGLDETGEGFVLFSLVSHTIALLIMLPVTICAGMTLPLFTSVLFRQGQGEKAIGLIYSANTVGAILGVVFAVFIGMPLMGIKGAIIFAGLIDIIIGVLLLRRCATPFRSSYPVYGVGMLILLTVISLLIYQLDVRQMASGVFRHGMAELDDRSRILFHEDGKTATVTVTEWNGELSVMTNGKTDATVAVEPGILPSTDESTMTLLAALPLSIHPGARTIANIGLGSGMTAHTALAWPGVERVDTIEIESAMVRAARHFGPKTSSVFNDARSTIHIDDARTYFSASDQKYDIIISEPSNPWVSGVSSLFTTGFYRLARQQLQNDGLLVQWIHIYEFNMDLLISVLKAMSEVFPYYSIYFADDGNLLLIASVDSGVGFPDPSIFGVGAMKDQLASVQINNIGDLSFRFLGDQFLFGPYIHKSTIPANSDYNQYLDQYAAKARFMKQTVAGLLDMRLSPVPILDLLYVDQARRDSTLSKSGYYPTEDIVHANTLYAYFGDRSEFGDTTLLAVESVISISGLNFLLETAGNCTPLSHPAVWINSIYRVMETTAAYLPTDQLQALATSITPDCGSNFMPVKLVPWLDLYRAYGNRDMAAVLEATVRLLKTDSELTVDQARFLFTGLLAGLIKVGENNQAARIWKENMADLYAEKGGVPLEMEILLAHLPVSDPANSLQPDE